MPRLHAIERLAMGFPCNRLHCGVGPFVVSLNVLAKGWLGRGIANGSSVGRVNGGSVDVELGLIMAYAWDERAI